MSDHVANPVYTLTVSGNGKQYVEISPFGSATIQAQGAGMSFKLYGTNDKVKHSNVPFAVDGDSGSYSLGDTAAPGDLGVVDVVLGNFKYLAIDILGGTGVLSVCVGNGLKLV